MRGLIFSALLFLIAGTSRAQETRELYRIRIINRDNGLIQVSDNGGKNYIRIGKVLRPATSSARGFSASVFSEPGRVVATAVHGVRIKTGGLRDCPKEESQTISIIPQEFAHTPDGFGGYVAGTSGIYTDIPTAQAMFRNLSPFVGNIVFREVGGDLHPLFDGYYPRDGDVLVIVVTVPKDYPQNLTIENRQGGSIRLVYPGREEQVAQVKRPIRGIGRE